MLSTEMSLTEQDLDNYENQALIDSQLAGEVWKIYTLYLGALKLLIRIHI